jgi:hypothetical protein
LVVMLHTRLTPNGGEIRFWSLSNLQWLMLVLWIDVVSF